MTGTSKKIIKIITTSITIAALLIGGTIAFFVTTINQDVIKKKTIQLVHDKTGRELKINGSVSWTFFPWLGIKMQNVSLSNHHDFKNTHFAEAKEVGINIKLLPLIFSHIEIGHLTLKNLDLQLIKNVSGKSNWQDLLPPNNMVTPSNTDKDSKINLAKFTIGNIAIDNGNVFWQDQKINKKIKINKFNLHCKDINFEQPFDMTISFYLSNLTSSLDGEVTANTQAKLDINKELYEFRQLRLTGKLKNKAIEKFFDLIGNANIKLDLKKQLLLADNLELNIAGTTAIGSLQCANITDDPSFSGNLTVNNSDSKALMQLLGINKYLKKEATAGFKITLALLPKIIKLQPIEARFNDMILQGNAEYTANKVAFNISLNKLDLNAFTSESSKTPTTTAIKTPTVINSPLKIINKVISSRRKSHAAMTVTSGSK